MSSYQLPSTVWSSTEPSDLLPEICGDEVEISGLWAKSQIMCSLLHYYFPLFVLKSWLFFMIHYYQLPPSVTVKHLCFHLNINTVFFTITYRSALWLLSLCSSASPSCLYQVRTVSHFTFVLFSQPFKWDGSQGGCSAPWTATLNTSSLNTVGQTSCETARTLIPTRTLTLNMKNIKDFLSL